MERIRIGCSGWNYRHWRGPYYPEKMAARNWFAFYAETFETVEINNSFYRLPKPQVFEKWRDQAPAGFRYAVKASRYLTHYKRLKELPPRWALDRARLEHFLAVLPTDLIHVLEFRDESWMTEAVLALLDAHGIGFCTHDMPGLTVPRRASGKAAYVRFHGGTGKYRGRYPDEVLQGWADWMVAEAKGGRPVWAYFNNDIDAAAIQDALTLRAMVAQAGR